jgi:hypothetical protein
MKKIILILVTLLFLRVEAQPPAKFRTRFGGEGIDIGYGVQEIYNRQYIIAGSSTSFGNGSSDAYLLLADSMGNLLWQHIYGGVGADMAKSVLINIPDSGFVFSGYTNSYGNGGFDVYVVRTDKNGNMIWQSSFGGLDWDFGNDLAFSSDGNVIVCGNSYNSVYGKNEGYILKVNIATGALIWEKKYGGAEDDDFQRIKPTLGGNFSLAGNTKSYGDINNDFWFFRINSNGDSLTSAVLGNPNKKETCYDFIQDTNNDLVFCGSYDTSFANIGKNISYVLKTTQNGVFISEHKEQGAFTNDDKFSSIVSSKQGNEYFFSRKVYYTGGVYDIEVQPFLMDYNYTFLQATTYGDIKDDETYKVISTVDNGFAMVGYATGTNQTTKDVFFIKLDHSLLGSNVGIPENNETPEEQSKTYYFDNMVYVENKRRNELTYQIINSLGKIMQSGKTKEASIFLTPNLPEDIYLIRIIEKPTLNTKFIKN